MFALTSPLLAGVRHQSAAESVIVRGQFGGLIFGFDIDSAGTEGLLAEAVENNDGTIHAALETFDQTTGEITAATAWIATVTYTA